MTLGTFDLEPPDTQRLTQALRAFFDAPDYENEMKLRPVLEAFVESSLITIDSEEEDSMLSLFTDLVELHMFAPDARWIAMPAEEAIKAVARGEFDGIIVNPGGQSFELSHDDVRDFFDIDDIGDDGENDDDLED